MTKPLYFSIIEQEMVFMKVSKKNKKNNKKNNKKKKKKNNYKKSIDNVVLIVFFAILLCIPNRIKLIVNGNRQVTMLWNEEYKEQGATLKRCSFLFCKKIDKKITITGDVDVTKLGTYKVKYSIKYKRRNYDNTRQVTVTEKEMPVIELIGNKELTCSGKKYIEEGYIATDNYDGDITDKVVVKEKKNGIHYFVSDTAQNTIEVIRKRSYEDNETPTIELKGSSEIILSKDTEYKEPGYRAKDNCDGDLTDKVIINGNVDTSKPGEYIITYTVSDGIGNNTSVERKVIVTKM